MCYTSKFFPGSVIRRGLKYFSSGLVVVKLGDILSNTPLRHDRLRRRRVFVSGGRWLSGALLFYIDLYSG